VLTKIAAVAFTTHQIQKPPGVVPAGYMAWLTQNNATVGMVQLPATANSCTFTITEPGVYVARVVRVSDDGSSIGPAAESDPVIVTEEMVEVPFTVTLTIADAVATPKSVKMSVK
jgi:hypothetical protein